jgi:hypothetical protein
MGRESMTVRFRASFDTPTFQPQHAFYILPNRERTEAGLRKLDKTLRTKYGIKG